MVVKFDNKDVDEMRDLPRIVADTPVGTEVEAIEVLRNGKETTLPGAVGRLEEGEKLVNAAATPEATEPAAEVLGMKLSRLTADIQDQVQAAR